MEKKTVGPIANDTLDANFTENLYALMLQATSFFNESSLKRNVSKVRTHANTLVVIEFKIRSVRFAFDLVPNIDKNVSIYALQRTHLDEIKLLKSKTNKEKIEDSIPVENALYFIETEATLMLKRLRHHFDIIAAQNEFPLIDMTKPYDFEAFARESKKVGIITLPLNRNIGGNLQAYALTQTLKNLGHQPMLINRRRPIRGSDTAQDSANADNKLFSDSIGFENRIPNVDFIEKHITPISKLFSNSVMLKNDFPKYGLDAVIVGSDQVWRPKYAKSIFPDLFLNFISESDLSVKRISYAASFGAPKWEYDAKQSEMASTLAKRFDHISVREDIAVALCKENLGVSATHVLDPTMLLDANHYIEKFSLASRYTSGDRLLTYILDIDSDKAEVVREIKERLSLQAYMTNGEPFVYPPLDGEALGDKSVESWLSSIYQSSFVMTDSFHGTVFAILFNKPFVAYGNPKRGLARFTSLLKMFDLESRLVTKSTPASIDTMLNPINWDHVNRRLEHFRNKSFAFLDNALGARPISDISDSAFQKLELAESRNKVAELGACENPLNVLCTGCGVCVSESRGTLKMSWNDDGFLAPVALGTNIPDDSIKVCPFNPNPDPEVQDEDALADIFFPNSSSSDLKVGKFENCYIGYSKEFRPTSSSGGIATYVFENLLLGGHVQYLYIVQTDGDSGYKYAVCRSVEDIKSISKTRYFPVTMDDLFSIIDNTDGRVAVSGVACFIKAIRLKQHYRPEYREKIAFTVGIICGGLKSKLYTDYLAQGAGISGPYMNPEYRIKEAKSTASDYSFSAINRAGRIKSIKMRKIGNSWGAGYFKAKACDFCTDVLTELADISVGDAWLQKYRADGMGNSIVVTRSVIADMIIRKGIQTEELVMDEVAGEVIARSQNGGFNHKQGGLPFRVWAAEFFTNLPVPHVRQRLLRKMEISQAVVQIYRERTRVKSLRLWKEEKDFTSFNRRIKKARLDLDIASAARKDGSNDFLLTLLKSRTLSTASLASRNIEGKRNPLKRWILRLLQGQQVSFGLLRSALLSSNTIMPSDKQKRTEQEKKRISSP